jgi:hypothetical protein
LNLDSHFEHKIPVLASNEQIGVFNNSQSLILFALYISREPKPDKNLRIPNIFIQVIC